MPDDAIEPLSLPSLLDRAVQQYGPRPAMSFMGRRWTYAELGAWVARLARGLQESGVGPGDRVGLCLPNTPYFVVAYFAALRVGATIVNYNPLYVARELRAQIEDSQTTLMVIPDLAMIHDKVAGLLGTTTLRRLVVCPMAEILPRPKAVLYRLLKRKMTARVHYTDRVRPLSALTASSVPPAPVEIDPARDIAVLQYTGGTTGEPKAAMLSHANLTANAHQVSRHMPSFRLGQERMMAVLPFFHVFAMTAIMNSGIECGAELLLHPRFELKATLRAIARDRATIFHGVPTIYAAIATAAEKHPTRLDSLRICISGGAPLPAEVRARFQRLTGCKLVEGYGLTEASPVLACNPPDGLIKDGSVGPAMLGTTVEIRDLVDLSRVLGPGERGEICGRGPQVMRGYWNRPEATADIFVDGALRTGDVGHLDEDGYLFITDRIKDVILCGGYNVYPRVIEDALHEHQAVAEAIVIGIPDAYRGQAPKAFVVLRPGQTATPEELLTFLGGYVSRIEIPKSIEIRTTLPKTLIGKLSRKELVAEEAAQEDT